MMVGVLCAAKNECCLKIFHHVLSFCEARSLRARECPPLCCKRGYREAADCHHPANFNFFNQAKCMTEGHSLKLIVNACD